MNAVASSRDAHHDPRARIVAAFVAVYIVWGSTYLAIRYAVQTIPPFVMVGTRFAVSGVILYAWARWRGSPRPTAAQWRDATVTGALMLCCGNGAVSWAEQRVPSGIASLLVAVVPLWMVLVEWLRPRGERPRALVVAGVVIGLLGLAVLVGPASFRGEGDVDSAGAVVLILGSLAWAAGSVFNRHGSRPDSAAMSTGLQMVGGSVALLLLGVMRGEIANVHLRQISAASWARNSQIRSRGRWGSSWQRKGAASGRRRSSCRYSCRWPGARPGRWRRWPRCRSSPWSAWAGPASGRWP